MLFRDRASFRLTRVSLYSKFGLSERLSTRHEHSSKFCCIFCCILSTLFSPLPNELDSQTNRNFVDRWQATFQRNLLETRAFLRNYSAMLVLDLHSAVFTRRSKRGSTEIDSLTTATRNGRKAAGFCSLVDDFLRPITFPLLP